MGGFAGADDFAYNVRVLVRDTILSILQDSLDYQVLMTH